MKCKFVLSISLLQIFNKPLATGIFPDKWKMFCISPVFKIGDFNNVINQNPIFFIISIIPKELKALG